jgi:hypothetical protein
MSDLEKLLQQVKELASQIENLELSEFTFKQWESAEFTRKYRVWSLDHQCFGYVPQLKDVTQEARYYFTHDDHQVCFHTEDEIRCYPLKDLIDTKHFIITTATDYLDTNKHRIYEGDLLIDKSVFDDSDDLFQVVYSLEDGRFCLYRGGVCVSDFNRNYPTNFKIYTNIFEIGKIMSRGVANFLLSNLTTKVEYYLPVLTFDEAVKIRDSLLPFLSPTSKDCNWEVNVNYLNFTLLVKPSYKYLTKLPDYVSDLIQNARGV